jgi:hypothetical protein
MYDMYDLMISGHPSYEIAKAYNLCEKRFGNLMNEIFKKTSQQNRYSILGRKDEAYYECEEDYGVTPNYSYDELSLNEKKFYEDKNK